MGSRFARAECSAVISQTSSQGLSAPALYPQGIRRGFNFFCTAGTQRCARACLTSRPFLSVLMPRSRNRATTARRLGTGSPAALQRRAHSSTIQDIGNRSVRAAHRSINSVTRFSWLIDNRRLPIGGGTMKRNQQSNPRIVAIAAEPTPNGARRDSTDMRAVPLADLEDRFPTLWRSDRGSACLSAGRDQDAGNLQGFRLYAAEDCVIATELRSSTGCSRRQTRLLSTRLGSEYRPGRRHQSPGSPGGLQYRSGKIRQTYGLLVMQVRFGTPVLRSR